MELHFLVIVFVPKTIELTIYNPHATTAKQAPSQTHSEYKKSGFSRSVRSSHLIPG